MLIARRRSSTRYKRVGIESFLLLSPRNSKSVRLSITLVELNTNGMQKSHRHVPEQIYYILEGTGLMQVGNEKEQVTAGDCIFIPSTEVHGLMNSGNRPLKYLSACSPAFSRKRCEELWPLESIEYMQE